MSAVWRLVSKPHLLAAVGLWSYLVSVLVTRRTVIQHVADAVQLAVTPATVALSAAQRPASALTLPLPLAAASTHQPHSAPVSQQAAMQDRMAARSHLITRTCNISSKYRAPAISQNLFYDREHSLLWCPVFKAGSTSWLNIFCKVHKIYWFNMDTGKSCPIHALRRHLGSIPGYWRVPTAPRHAFLVVRHPMERLLSAYRDKLEGPHVHQFYRKKVARMIGRHRRYDTVPQPVSAAELQAPPPPPATPPPAPLSFAEFLRSVAAADVLDEHWKPYYGLCTPCNVHYDLVGKFETLREDRRYILAQLGLDAALADETDLLPPAYANRNLAGGSGAATVRRYFSQVTAGEVMRVYRLFKLDFVMFNYTIDEFLQYTRPDDGPAA